MAFCGRAARDEERSADGVRAERDALRSECEARWAQALCLGWCGAPAARVRWCLRGLRRCVRAVK